MSEFFLLTLIAPPSLEEPLVDWLLQYEHPSGFSSFPINGHSSRPESLTLVEQVTGRKRQIQFEVRLAGPDLNELLDRLKKDFAESAMRYWVSPVVDGGRL
ncbi:DUF3240 family protein [Methylocaldum sp.]|uniref:DUF3240 family protein n=1 Tax=Methylocaldum sp. TaxID=1969727 RepID=UPI002D2E5B9B|nr:DUF3240 family protein [Methylocaldum sp.]HYE37289.1 DUF3240 family protein [Methylocaldum sp.]